MDDQLPFDAGEIQPRIIEVGCNDYIAKVRELKAIGHHIEQIKPISGGYRLTVGYETVVRGIQGV